MNSSFPGHHERVCLSYLSHRSKPMSRRKPRPSRPRFSHFSAGDLPAYSAQPAANNHMSGIPWGIENIRAPEVWKKSQGDKIRIAVIDTGVDFHHPNLQGALEQGINLVRPLSLPWDDNGHGTHIAGTIAARSTTHDLIGVAPKSHIVPVKAFDKNGTAYVSDIVNGLHWCVEQKVHIINMSFGMSRPSQALYKAVRRAYDAGIIVVASAGNDGRNHQIDYPARFPETIAVGATDSNHKRAPFSNTGQGIDLYAPGDRIVSAWPGYQYHLLSGTSMATAHVSGLIALLLVLRPRLKREKLKAVLKRSGIPISAGQASRNTSLVQRFRRIDAWNALRALNNRRKAPR